MRHWLRTSPNGESSLAPVLLLILIVALPTAAVLWLMNEATQNERLAVRQRLADVYRLQLETVRQRVVAGWREALGELDTAAAGLPPAQAFATCVRRGLADSVVILNSKGRPSYPDSMIWVRDDMDETADWRTAREFEFTDRNYAAAAQAYGRIAQNSTDDNSAGRAIQAQVRSLLGGGDPDSAIQVLSKQVENPRMQAAIGPDDRWLWADLMLLLIDTTKDSNRPLASKTACELASRVNDYSRAPLGAAQRRFVMRELHRLFPDIAPARMLIAEDLAAEYLEHSSDRTTPRDLEPAGIEDVWKVASPQGRVLAILRTTAVLPILNRKLEEGAMPPGVQLAIHRPADPSNEKAFLSLAIGPDLPRWQVALTLAEDPFGDAATERSRTYFWTAAVTILVTGSLALFVALALRRQMRLSRLKNDLVATVSHELKTPLSSIRLLVDTLLEQSHSDPQQTREYLQLVARENQRLSRLIDNFLTFSRMERGKQRLAAGPVEPGEIARRAAEALHERLSEPNCQFELHIEPDLSPVAGDIDALVMVLVNLLDNALKYSGPQKRIVMRVIARADQVCFAVEDNGLGLSPRHKRRVFDRFYQVDQQLTRAAGGCGLGLSIVRSIVSAHGGSVEVESEPGKGSTFLVTLPALKSTDRLQVSCTTS